MRRLRATLVVIRVVRQLRGTRRVRPAAFFGHVQPGLVEIGHRGAGRSLLDARLVSANSAAHDMTAACSVPSDTG